RRDREAARGRDPRDGSRPRPRRRGRWPGRRPADADADAVGRPPRRRRGGRRAVPGRCREAARGRRVNGPRVAAVQPPSFMGADEWKNAEQAVGFIDQAADAGAAYVVFPEGYPGPYSGPMANDALDRVRDAARRRRVWVSAGRLEPAEAPDTFHITHKLIDDGGDVRATYRRVQPNHPIFNAYLMGGRHHVLPG